MSAERSAVDSNVLVYALFPDTPQHGPSRRLVERAQDADAGLCVFPQNVAELFSVVTNPKRVAVPLSVEDALSAIERLLALPGLTLLPLPASAVGSWVSLVRSSPVSGMRIFDRQLVAAMTEHGVRTIYTFNVKDFTNLPGITPVDPTSLAATPPGAP